jgi:hypothetical protein
MSHQYTVLPDKAAVAIVHDQVVSSIPFGSLVTSIVVINVLEADRQAEDHVTLKLLHVLAVQQVV